jgi:hypothetical protein
MSKKRSPKSKKAGQVPMGLRLGFTIMNNEDPTGDRAIEFAAKGHAAAQRILEVLTPENEGAIWDEVRRTARVLYPGYTGTDGDAAEQPSAMGETGFVVGFATCWLVMTSMSGRGGA